MNEHETTRLCYSGRRAQSEGRLSFYDYGENYHSMVDVPVHGDVSLSEGALSIRHVYWQGLLRRSSAPVSGLADHFTADDGAVGGLIGSEVASLMRLPRLPT